MAFFYPTMNWMDPLQEFINKNTIHQQKWKKKYSFFFCFWRKGKETKNKINKYNRSESPPIHYLLLCCSHVVFHALCVYNISFSPFNTISYTKVRRRKKKPIRYILCGLSAVVWIRAFNVQQKMYNFPCGCVSNTR